MVELFLIVKKKPFRKILLYILLSLLVIFLAPVVIAYVTSLGKRFPLGVAPQGKTALVFGAGLYRDGSPSPVLRDRVSTAVELYKAGKVEKMLMSGDNSTLSYNEPGAMKKYAMQLGVPEDAIVLDYAGRRTYDTCYRAKAIFGITKATLVTQDYHLPRALFICRNLGLDAVGVSADRRVYSRMTYIYWRIREVPATLSAFIDVLITHPEPILGDPLPIYPPDGDNMEQIYEDN